MKDALLEIGLALDRLPISLDAAVEEDSHLPEDLLLLEILAAIGVMPEAQNSHLQRLLHLLWVVLEHQWVVYVPWVAWVVSEKEMLQLDLRLLAQIAIGVPLVVADSLLPYHLLRRLRLIESLALAVWSAKQAIPNQETGEPEPALLLVSLCNTMSPR